MADLNMLDQYLSFSVNKESNTINFDNFLLDFDVKHETADMLSEIVRQMVAKEIVIEE